jgi:hypothetical protein
MLERTPQNLLSIEDLVSNPEAENRDYSPVIHEDPRPGGSLSLPVLGRFPDLDRMVSEGQDHHEATAESGGGHSDRAARSEGTDHRRGRWISQKLSAQVLAAAGLLLLFAAIALFPRTKTDEASDTRQATKAKSSAPPAAVAIQPVEIRNSPLPGKLPGGETKELSASVMAAKKITPLQEKGKTGEPQAAPAPRVADRRSGISENASAVNPTLSASPPMPRGTVTPGGATETGAGGDFVKWPRPASEAGGGSRDPPVETTPRGTGCQPVLPPSDRGTGYQPVLPPSDRGTGYQPVLQPTAPQAPRVSVLRNPYI